MFRSTAHELEYRWRFAILIGSQPAMAFAASRLSGMPGQWYAPAFTLEVGILGTILTCLGVLLRVWGTSLLSVEVMSSNRPQTNRPMTRGLYGVVRNPLYVGTTLLFAGYGLFFGWIAGVFFAAFHFLRCHRVILLEEQHLAGRWGTAFADYCRLVPRWLPRVRMLRRAGWPVVSTSGVLANALFIGIALGCVASTITGNLSVLIPFECAGGAVLALYFWLNKPHRQTSCTKRPRVPEKHERDRRVDTQTRRRQSALTGVSCRTTSAYQTSRAFPFRKE